MKIAEGITGRQLVELRREIDRELARIGPAAGLVGDTRRSARHAELVDAKTRMEDGTYGSCAVCGDPISFGRLLVMPEATRCIVCAGGAKGQAAR